MLFQEGEAEIYKKILWSLISIVVIIIGVFTVIIYQDMNADSDTNNNGEEHNETLTSNQQKKDKSNKHVNPFNEKSKRAELTDKHFRNYIHQMSHQKVEATDKWGFYKITNERIQWLLGALEEDDVKRRLTDGDVYYEILTRWKNSDFSQVDEDHNAIWRLQGGTIGEATGILSAEDEAQYIENTPESK